MISLLCLVPFMETNKFSQSGESYGNTPLPEQMMIQSTDAYMRH